MRASTNDDDDDDDDESRGPYILTRSKMYFGVWFG